MMLYFHEQSNSYQTMVTIVNFYNLPEQALDRIFFRLCPISELC